MDLELNQESYIRDPSSFIQWCIARSIEVCVVFGSRARGSDHPGSDFDLAVKPMAMPAPLERVAWQSQLEQIVDAEVSLVVLTVDTDPVLGWEIARDGKLVYECEEGRWMGERARLWHLYNDALPFRRALDESLRQYAREVLHAS